MTSQPSSTENAFKTIKDGNGITIVDPAEIAAVRADDMPGHTNLYLRGGSVIRIASPMAKVLVALGEPWVTLGGGAG